jgi:prepilin signal peptidase PulO-like enzyme (type II secretory pathway)
VVVVGVATARLTRRQKVPFGPFIAIGGIVALLAQSTPPA